MGAEDLSTEGLLLVRIDLWIQSVPNYPVLNKSQSQVIKELLPKLVGEAMSLKTSLYQAYVNLTQKLATTDIPANKEAAILVVIAESNKGATTQELVLSWRSMLSLGLLKLPIPGSPAMLPSLPSPMGQKQVSHGPTWLHMAPHGPMALQNLQNWNPEIWNIFLRSVAFYL